MYLKRTIENKLNIIKNQFCCITILGARQVGKSTLSNILFKEFKTVSLDSLDLRASASSNPRLFLENHPYPLIIDEIQKAPTLLNEIKILIDQKKIECLKKNIKPPLMFVLTGSNQFELQKNITDSLAGRTAIIKLSPLANNEIEQIEGHLFDPNFEILKTKINSCKCKYKTRKEIFINIFKGGMPEYIVNDIDRNTFFNSYIETYIEKDIKQLIEVNKEKDFKKFLDYMALRTAQQLNYDDISRNVGIDSRTVKKWISLLISSGIAFTLKPYCPNLSNRITKMEKFYFFDTGLCSYLCKWPTAEMIENGVMNGAFYETYVISEIAKSFMNEGLNINDYLFYYRDRDKKEVDLIIEQNNSIFPIEIKKGINPINDKFNFKFLEKLNKKIMPGLIIDSNKELFKINSSIINCPLFLIGL